MIATAIYGRVSAFVRRHVRISCFECAVTSVGIPLTQHPTVWLVGIESADTRSCSSALDDGGRADGPSGKPCGTSCLTKGACSFTVCACKSAALLGEEDDSAWFETELPALLGRLAAERPAVDWFDAIVVDEGQDFSASWWPPGLRHHILTGAIPRFWSFGYLSADALILASAAEPSSTPH